MENSGGTVSLKSTNPFDHPLIDPRFLEHPFDIHTMVESMKAAKKFVSASAWKDYVIAPYGPPASVVTDADLATYARENAARCVTFLSSMHGNCLTIISRLASCMPWERQRCRPRTQTTALSTRTCVSRVPRGSASSTRPYSRRRRARTLRRQSISSRRGRLSLSRPICTRWHCSEHSRLLVSDLNIHNSCRLKLALPL